MDEGFESVRSGFLDFITINTSLPVSTFPCHQYHDSMRGTRLAQAMSRCSSAAQASLRATTGVGVVTRTMANEVADFMGGNVVMARKRIARVLLPHKNDVRVRGGGAVTMHLSIRHGAVLFTILSAEQ